MNSARPTWGGTENVGRVELTDSAHGTPAKERASSGWAKPGWVVDTQALVIRVHHLGFAGFMIVPLDSAQGRGTSNRWGRDWRPGRDDPPAEGSTRPWA